MRKDFFKFETYEKQEDRIELTAVLTNYLLREGIGNNKEYRDELEILNRLAINDNRVNNALNMFKRKRSNSIKEIFNRYEAIKKELLDFNPDILIIGAAGLSPLGYAYALRNPNTIVYDTDLDEIVKYRTYLLPRINNYNLEVLDLLKNRNIKNFVCNKKIKGKVAYVIEGLTFYLDRKKQIEFHKNLQKSINNDMNDVIIIFEYYTSDISVKDKDAGFIPKTEEEKDYITIFKSIYSNQGIKPKTNEDIFKFLMEQNYKEARLSNYTYTKNPQKVWVCKY